MTSERWYQLRTLYNHTLEIPSEDRESFLSSLGKQAPATAAELRALIVTDSYASLLHTSTTKPSADTSKHVFIPGQCLCERFEIIRFIASGGMGEVYEAYDKELHESVALKTVRAEIGIGSLSADLFRNEVRRARAIASPYVCRVHDLFVDRPDQQSAVMFLSMQLLRGETLAERLERDGKLDESEAFLLLRQIAEGIDAAHRVGIVHGDLKSANIMLVRDGSDALHACITDFGLASKISHLPEERATPPDTLLCAGTPAWMAPEQLEKGISCPGTDIYALGLIAYEMLTGCLPFEGRTLSEISYNRLLEPPKPARDFLPELNPSWDKALSQCLEKEPYERFRTGTEFIAALTPGARRREKVILSQPLLAAGKRTWSWLSSFLFIVLGVSVAIALLWFWRQTVPLSPMQVVPLTAYPGEERQPSFSPDGKAVAFSWNGNGGDNPDVYVKSLESGKLLRLTTNPEPDEYPVWSPDKRWIAFVRRHPNGKWIVLVTSAGGGPERVLTEFDTPYPGLGGWSPDGRWLLVSGEDLTGQRTVLYLVSVENGTKRPITSHPAGVSMFDYTPAFAPNGRSIAFVRTAAPVVVSELPCGDIYILALTSDFSSKGQPRRLTFDTAEMGGIAWTKDSQDLIFSSRRDGSQSLWRLTASGSAAPSRLSVGNNALSPAVSPVTWQLAFSQTVPLDTNIWRLDLSSPERTPTQLVSSTHEEDNPQYSPDGRRIAFQSERSGKHEVWLCNADGSDPVQLTDLPYAGSPHWSPDGMQITFDAYVEGHWQIYTIPSVGGQALRKTVDAFNNIRPSWSHDGRWIYFASDHFGPYSLWKLPVSGGEAVQLTGEMDNTQFESADGKTLYYTRIKRKGRGVWRIGVEGDHPTEVLDFISDVNFTISRNGIYYANPTGLQFYNFATRKSRLISRLNKPLAKTMSVSPDGHWLLYSQVDQSGGGDLMLVENFR